MLDPGRIETQAGRNSTDAFWTIAVNGVIGVVGLTTGALVARLLGPVGRGELQAIQLWPVCIAMLAALGIPEAVVYWVARHHNRAGAYLTTAVVIVALSGTCFAAGAYFALPHLLYRQSPEVIRLSRWYLLYVPIYGISTASLFVFRPINLRSWNFWRMAPPFGWLLTLCYARFTSHAQPGFIALSYVVVSAGILFAQIAHNMLVVSAPFYFVTSAAAKLVRFGLPNVLTNFSALLNLRLDQMLIAAVFPNAALGLYVAAVAWGGISNPVLYGLGTVLFPRVALLQDRVVQIAAFAGAVRSAILIAFTLLIPLIAFTPIGFRLLFGERFTAGIPAAVILIVAGTVAGLNLVVEEGLRGLGHPGVVMRAEFCGLIVTAALLAALLKPFGIIGAAIASLISYTVVSIALLRSVTRLTPMPWTAFCPSRKDLATAWRQIETSYRVATRRSERARRAAE